MTMSSKKILLKTIHEEKYLISSDGHIYSMAHSNMREINYRISHKGYKIVTLCIGDKHKNMRVHRLVAEAFIPNPQKLPQVNHIDGNKLNNDVTNLEWCTCKQNVNHAQRIGLFPVAKPKVRIGKFHNKHERYLCNHCHELKPHYSFGLCKACYTRQWRKTLVL